MKLTIHPDYSFLTDFCHSLPARFANPEEGEVLRDLRNTIKRFRVEGVDVVVKRFGTITLFNRFLYASLRKSKARRGYEHAERLRSLGIGTPRAVAYMEMHRHGQLSDSYLITLCSEGQPLTRALEALPAPEACRVVDAFVLFLTGLHACGVLHDDLNSENILFHREQGEYRFELIDINRMRFKHCLSRRDRLCNLRRLTPLAPAYLRIVEHYSAIAGFDRNRSLFESCLYWLGLTRWNDFRHRLKRCFQKKEK